MNNYKNSNAGFTLIELIVTIAIVGIFASIALPSFSNLIKSNRISSGGNELMTSLLLAKSEALKRRNSVTLCPSTNQQSCSDSTDYSTGWIIFLDCEDIGDFNTGATPGCGPNDQEEIIRVSDGYDAIHMSNTNTSITFGYTGRPVNNGNSSFDLRENDTSPILRNVVINRVGRVRIANISN